MKLNPFKTVETLLTINYPDYVPDNLRKQYSEILVSRAVRFYLENEMDSSIINEDFHDDAEENEKCNYPNLEYSRQEEIKYQRELKKLLKKY